MSCVLRVSGKEFDAPSFAAVVGLEGRTWLRGELDRRGRRCRESGGSFIVSDAEFTEFARQQAEAIAFLTKRGTLLRRLLRRTHADSVVLDFGIHWRADVVAQFVRFGPDLVRLAGGAGLGLETSLYPPPGWCANHGDRLTKRLQSGWLPDDTREPFGRKGEKRYSAKLLFQYRRIASGKRPERRFCEERVMTFRARTDTAALRVARRLGREAQCRTGTLSGDGALEDALLEFVGVLDLKEMEFLEREQAHYRIRKMLAPMERREKILPSDETLLGRV